MYVCICVNCRLGLACTVRAGLSETALYDSVRFFFPKCRLALNRKICKKKVSFQISLRGLRKLI